MTCPACDSDDAVATELHIGQRVLVSVLCRRCTRDTIQRGLALAEQLRDRVVADVIAGGDPDEVIRRHVDAAIARQAN